MKTCFKCGTTKPLNEFYAHPQMADGHLNKCKNCTRADTAKRVAYLSQTNLRWVETELKRHRDKAALYRAMGKRSDKAIVMRGKLAWQDRNKHKRAAHLKVQRALKSGLLQKQPCKVCGTLMSIQAHHDDYSRPLDVMWLCVTHHAQRHVELNAQRRAADFVTKRTSEQ